MKNLTVLAAALAAGLMTFAANAQEEGPRHPSAAHVPEVGVSKERNGKAEEKAAATQRGLSAEEVFHAIAAVEKEKQQAAATPEDRYKPIVEKYALENGVPVDLAHAVITVESNYKVYSLGKAGEVGLMQIKPATAKMMGYEGTATGLFDPETNIKFGMKYLGKARQLGGGTTCGTILKYNAGHSAKRMNATSRDYCAKVKRHLTTAAAASIDFVAERELDRGA